jgi:hypothetical protein
MVNEAGNGWDFVVERENIKSFLWSQAIRFPCNRLI